MAGALCRGQEGSRRQSQWSTWRECGLKWPREEGTRQMGQGSNLWAECPDWRVGCFGAIQSAFGTAKGMRLGTSGVRGEVRAGGGVWGVTSISVIAAPREVDRAEGGPREQGTMLTTGRRGPCEVSVAVSISQVTEDSETQRDSVTQPRSCSYRGCELG